MLLDLRSVAYHNRNIQRKPFIIKGNNIKIALILQRNIKIGYIFLEARVFVFFALEKNRHQIIRCASNVSRNEKETLRTNNMRGFIELGRSLVSV